MKPGRHKTTEVRCEQCGKSFLATDSRIREGRGRFCSIKCAGLAQIKPERLGKENGKKYWDKKPARWVVRWYDENRHVHVQNYARWWWEINKGEVPDGYLVVCKDGNKDNLLPDNFELRTKQEHGRIRGNKALGVPKPTIAGANNKWWRGGSSYEGYPTKFSKPLKKRIKIRDNYTCQACNSIYPSQQLDVHHIDRNLENNDEHNLVTLCRSCHSAVHGKSQKSNDKIRYYQSLLPE